MSQEQVFSFNLSLPLLKNRTFRPALLLIATLACLVPASTAFASGAALTSPAPGSVFPGSTVTFSWSPASGAVSQYQLWVGSTPNHSDNLGLCYGMSTTCKLTSLPTNGATVYVTLAWEIGGSWTESDYTYKAASSSASAPKLSCASGSMTGAGTDSCTVTLSKAAASGSQAVTLASSATAVTVPSSMTVASGATSASFTAKIAAVTTAQTATLTASSGGGSSTYAIKLGAGTTQGKVSGLSCTSSSITGAGTDSCTVTLSKAAASGGQAVTLASNATAVTVPSSVTVASGATKASFTATVAAVTTAQTATLTASSGGGSSTYAIKLNANSTSTVATLSLQSTSVAFGDVALNTPSYQSVTLTSSGTASLTISAGAVTGTGFSMSGVSFPVTLGAGQTATLQVEFDPTVAGAASGNVTLTSNSSTGATSTISLNGTGEAATSYQVNLSWDAPSSSPVGVTGYNIYRETGSSGSYQLINSSADASTSYTDSTVACNTSYTYYVESVDAEGDLSAPSNSYTVSVPQ